MKLLNDLLKSVLDADDYSFDMDTRQTFSSDVYSAGVLADAVVTPSDKQKCAEVVAVLTDAGYAIVTRGGGMSYTGGYLPQQPKTVVIDVSKLNKIIEINAEDLYITVEAGVTWKSIYELLKPLGLRLPFFGTFSGSRATVGGGLSNGALFLGTARYGTAADCMLGLEVILADGTLLPTGQAAFKNSKKPFYRTYGPDISGLFVHDSGTFGIKVQATLRLIRTPQYSGYASFVFDGMQAAGAALSEVARTGAAEEAYVFDPPSTRKNLISHGIISDTGFLLKVVRNERSILRGAFEGFKLVLAGRKFLPKDGFALHIVCTGRTSQTLDTELAACRAACLKFGGLEIPNSIPKTVRASLFPELDSMLGPNGDRWAALNAKVAHSDASKIMKICAEAIKPYEEQMKNHGVWMSHLLIAIGLNAFSFEPVFHWYDVWLPLHKKIPSSATLAKFPIPVDNPEARALVAKLREILIAIFVDLGAASNQIGKTYPYAQSLLPAPANLVTAIKKTLDTKGLMNPGGMGFS